MLIARILLLFYVSFVYSAPANSTKLSHAENCNSTENLLDQYQCATESKEYLSKIRTMLNFKVDIDATEVTSFLDGCKNYTSCMDNTCEPGAMKNDVELACTTVKVMRSKFKKCFDKVIGNIKSYDLQKYNCEGAKNYKPEGPSTNILKTQKECMVSIMNDVCEKGSTDNYDEYVNVFIEIVQVSKVLKPGMHAPKMNITFSD